MLTEGNYVVIWRAFVGGASDEEIIKGFGITEGTLDRIKRSKGNHQEFARLFKAEVLTLGRGKKEKEKQEQVIRHEQSVTIIANQYIAEELKKQTEQLELINRKLARILDDLYGIKTPENEDSAGR